jgi:ATP-dependent DNA helicase MPH1
MCHTYLQELSREGDGANSPSKGSKGKKKLKSDADFQAVLRELEKMTPVFPVHPKMDLLKTLLVQHFGQALREEGEEELQQTRVMVFSTFREAVDELVTYLESEKPLIKATRFIGQGTDKQGKKGMSQKEQLEVRCIAFYCHC